MDYDYCCMSRYQHMDEKCHHGLSLACCMSGISTYHWLVSCHNTTHCSLGALILDTTYTYSIFGLFHVVYGTILINHWSWNMDHKYLKSLRTCLCHRITIGLVYWPRMLLIEISNPPWHISRLKLSRDYWQRKRFMQMTKLIDLIQYNCNIPLCSSITKQCWLGYPLNNHTRIAYHISPHAIYIMIYAYI